MRMTKADVARSLVRWLMMQRGKTGRRGMIEKDGRGPGGGLTDRDSLSTMLNRGYLTWMGLYLCKWQTSNMVVWCNVPPLSDMSWRLNIQSFLFGLTQTFDTIKLFNNREKALEKWPQSCLACPLNIFADRNCLAHAPHQTLMSENMMRGLTCLHVAIHSRWPTVDYGLACPRGSWTWEWIYYPCSGIWKIVPRP